MYYSFPEFTVSQVNTFILLQRTETLVFNNAHIVITHIAHKTIFQHKTIKFLEEMEEDCLIQLRHNHNTVLVLIQFLFYVIKLQSCKA